MTTDPTGTIAETAAEIDHLDEKITDLLGERFRLSRHIGALKLAASAPPTDSSRIAGQMARFVALARARSLDEMMAARLIDVILGQVVLERERLFRDERII